MLEVTARDGRARTTAWKPNEGGMASTPTIVWPATSLAAAPDWAQVRIASQPAPGSPHVQLVSGGTWFHPTPSTPTTIGILVPAIQPAPSTQPQTILAGTELAILHDAGGWARNPKNLVKALIEARTTATPARLLWAPVLGTPQDYALWAYLGIDLFDASPLLLAAVRGEVLTADGPLTATQAAAIFGGAAGDWDTQRILAHNAEAARAELLLVQHHIREGTLRQLAERRAYTRATLIETLRLFDREHAYLESAAPHQRTGPLPCMTVESLWMPEVEAFRRRVREGYQPPGSSAWEGTAPASVARPDILVLLPCSARKPYKLSRSHRQYIRALDESGVRGRVHEVMVTSPLGLVPRELEEMYPANAYDIPVTGHWMRDEQEIVREQLRSLLAKGNYRHVVAHVGASTLAALADLFPAGFHDTVRNHPTASDDTKRLAETLAAIAAADPKPIPGWPTRRIFDMAALASFQLGPTVAADLVAGAQTHGRPPFVKLEGPEGQRATTTQERGQLSLTLGGAAILGRHATHRVHLQNFDLKKTSSLFAVGIEGADPGIRVGDEVVLVRGDEVKGSGTALMSSDEMTHLNRGIAVQVRHIAGKADAKTVAAQPAPPQVVTA